MVVAARARPPIEWPAAQNLARRAAPDKDRGRHRIDHVLRSPQVASQPEERFLAIGKVAGQ
jgi:hypothetical protein